MVRVQEAASFVTELVSLRDQGAPFAFARCMEVIELTGEHVPQRGHDVLGDLHLPVVVLDPLLDVGHGHRLSLAARALGVPTCADEVWDTMPLLFFACVTISREPQSPQ
ncbi:hypothetical protein N8K70_05410 [Microbacterium betulae]|uniref:Uncharacterized protein n=1 Tax=Microbacterium betulae TaxID=2981139 RepID=A0AA97FKR6_9MICO|nr:hypothetical protein [Microbacterium sp. AB]WOF24110.1 hypothetical protein N8K70_05410 [Microbacterium sp. AB]